MDKKPDAIADFKSALVAKTAAALAAELQPAQVHALVERVIADALAGISSDQYSPVGRLVKEHLEAAARAYLDTPEAKAMIRAGVERAINEIMPKFTSEVRGRVIDRALAGLVDALKEKTRY